MFHPIRAAIFMSLAGTLQISTALGDVAPPAADSEVGFIGDQRLSFGELPPAARTDFDQSESRYEQQLHQQQIDHKRELQAIIEKAAQRYVDETVLRREADARNVTVEQIVREIKTSEVTDAQIRSFYDQNSKQIGQPFAAISAQIGQYLREQATESAKRTYLDGLRAKYAARVTLEPLREAVQAQGPSIGPSDARVTIVEFSDFQCPFCGQMAPVLKELVNKYPRDVRLVYRQLPLPDLHPNALGAAKASVCASQQGKFWEMHDAMFADQSALERDGLKKIADKLHLKSKAFDACLDSPQVAAAVEVDSKAAQEYGVSATPGLFINGRFVNGAVPLNYLVSVVEDELARQQGARAVARAN